MHIFHKWTKWEPYTWRGQVSYAGILYPENMRGKWMDATEERQRRTCTICGKQQDVLVSDH